MLACNLRAPITPRIVEMPLKAEFLKQNNTDISDQVILSVESCLVHCRAVSSIPGL